MKYLLVIGDGMADTGLAALDGKTPLEALQLSAFDHAAGCYAGQALTVPIGMPAGSDTAILSIFGYDPQLYYTGRSVLEAAGMGVSVPAGCLSLRINLCAVMEDHNGELVIHSHNGGGVHGEEARALMDGLMADNAFALMMKESGLSIFATDTFRHIGVMASTLWDLQALRLTEPHNVLMSPIGAYMPGFNTTEDPAVKALSENIHRLMILSYGFLRNHPVNLKRISEGKLPANMIWPWGAATAMVLPPFKSLFGRGGSVISAVPLVWGIACLAGLKTPRVKGANGELDTNYEGKADAALHALFEEGDDFAAIHVEAPDEMAHAGVLPSKLKAIQNVESRVVARLLEGLAKKGEDFRLLLLSDHPTLLTTRMHDGSPVPFAIYDSRIVHEALAAGKPVPARKFCEKEVAAEPVVTGTSLMGMLFEG